MPLPAKQDQWLLAILCALHKNLGVPSFPLGRLIADVVIPAGEETGYVIFTAPPLSEEGCPLVYRGEVGYAAAQLLGVGVIAYDEESGVTTLTELGELMGGMYELPPQLAEALLSFWVSSGLAGKVEAGGE